MQRGLNLIKLTQIISDLQIKSFINPNGQFLRLLNNNFMNTQDNNNFQDIKKKEYKWGVNMVKKYNIPIDGSLKFWSGPFGEYYVFSQLISMGKIVRRPEPINGLTPDWECDDFIYEVKTRNYSSKGSAGEKALGIPLKYSDIPELYKKPLKIILVGRMEYDGINKYNILHNNELGIKSSDAKSLLLNTYKNMGITFLGASKLV